MIGAKEIKNEDVEMASNDSNNKKAPSQTKATAATGSSAKNNKTPIQLNENDDEVGADDKSDTNLGQ